MSNNYYAVVRSDNYLAHYGVKGMKWGVRKAIEGHNDRALSKHFGKATKKLNKLAKKGNKEKYNKFRQAMAESFTGTEYGPRYSLKARELDKSMHKMEDDFYKSSAYEKVLRQMAKESAKKYGNNSKEDYESYYNFYKNGDGDQGESFMRYRKQNPKVNAQYTKLERQWKQEWERTKKHPSY